MSWLWRVTDRWALDEDEQLVEVLQRLYGPLLQLGFVFPLWGRSHLHITLAILACYVMALPTHLYLLGVSLSCLRDDYDQVSLEFHYWLIIILVMVILGLVHYNRSHMVEAHKTIGSDLGMYVSGRIYDEKVPAQLESDKSKQTLRFIFLPSLTVLLALLILLVPYIKKMDGEVHYNKRGANMKLPIVACYPFPTHEGILHVVAVLGQLMAAACLALTVVSVEFVMFRMTQELVFEYRVLQYALRTMICRAKSLHKQLHPENDPCDLDMMDPAFQKLIGQCLTDCLAHHHKIVNFSNVYSTLVKWPTASVYLIGTAIIGLSLINILAAQKSSNYENIVLFSLLAIGEVLTVLMISLFGEAITTEDGKLRHCLYDTNWYWFNKSNRMTMLNFQTGVIRPAVIKAGGVVNLNLDTFSSIMNTAYSFFNLMNTQ